MAIGIAPPVSSASPELTHPTGATLAIGGNVTGTNVGNILLTDSETRTLVECTTGRLTGTLTKNAGVLIEGNIFSATFSGTGGNFLGEKECTSPNLGGIGVTANPVTNGLPWCLKSGTNDTFTIRGNNCVSLQRPIRFELDTTIFGITCVYQRTAAITGTHTTHPSDAVLSISHVEFTSPTFGCPTQGFLDMSFTLETDTTPTSDPMFIS